MKKINDYMSTCKLSNHLTEDQKDLCDKPISLKECTNVVEKCMKPNKSPGLDGITVEFYKAFWPVISSFLIEVYLEIFKEENLTYSQKTAVITLIFKTGDRSLLKHYRPISLTNTDYKILAFVLAMRVQKVMPSVINNDQTGYIKNRLIGLNIRTVQDLIEYCNKFDKKGVLLFLDFNKAFDSLEWKFLQKVIKKFNFGPIFQKWVSILYTEAEAVIKNNGWLSESFNISRGIRQALLFIFAVEIMSTILRDDNSIKGIEIKNPCSSKTYKISQYADDSVIILEDTDQTAPLLGRMKQFGELAGLKLNLNKTEIMLLGTLKGKHKNIDNLECIDNIKSLGIYVWHDREYCIGRNWTDKINKIESMLKMWRERSLSLLGKILIIKALALPLVSFVALNSYTPDWIVKVVNKIFFNFVWGTTAKVKKDTLLGNIEQGGLKMIEVGSYFHALKASWVKRLCNASKDDTWAYIPTCIFKKLHVLEIIDLLSEPNISKDIHNVGSRSKNAESTTTLRDIAKWRQDNYPSLDTEFVLDEKPSAGWPISLRFPDEGYFF